MDATEASSPETVVHPELGAPRQENYDHLLPELPVVQPGSPKRTGDPVDQPGSPKRMCLAIQPSDAAAAAIPAQSGDAAGETMSTDDLLREMFGTGSAAAGPQLPPPPPPQAARALVAVVPATAVFSRDTEKRAEEISTRVDRLKRYTELIDWLLECCWVQHRDGWALDGPAGPEGRLAGSSDWRGGICGGVYDAIGLDVRELFKMHHSDTRKAERALGQNADGHNISRVDPMEIFSGIFRAVEEARSDLVLMCTLLMKYLVILPGEVQIPDSNLFEGVLGYTTAESIQGLKDEKAVRDAIAIASVKFLDGLGSTGAGRAVASVSNISQAPVVGVCYGSLRAVLRLQQWNIISGAMVTHMALAGVAHQRDESDEEIRVLLERISDLERRLSETEAKLERGQAHVDNLAAIMEKNKADAATLMGTMSDMDLQRAQLQQQLRELEYKQAKQASDDLKQTCSDLKSCKESCEESVKRIRKSQRARNAPKRLVEE